MVYHLAHDDLPVGQTHVVYAHGDHTPSVDDPRGHDLRPDVGRSRSRHGQRGTSILRSLANQGLLSGSTSRSRSSKRDVLVGTCARGSCRSRELTVGSPRALNTLASEPPPLGKEIGIRPPVRPRPPLPVAPPAPERTVRTPDTRAPCRRRRRRPPRRHLAAAHRPWPASTCGQFGLVVASTLCPHDAQIGHDVLSTTPFDHARHWRWSRRRDVRVHRRDRPRGRFDSAPAELGFQACVRRHSSEGCHDGLLARRPHGDATHRPGGVEHGTPNGPAQQLLGHDAWLPRRLPLRPR